MSKRIAIVEDEQAIRENYAAAFRRDGYAVEMYDSRQPALDAFNARLPDLVVIDINLQDEVEGGFELCRELRSKSADLPIIFLTARDSEFDAVSGLRLGADDYLTKDISLPHLMARVAALFRRLEVMQQPSTAESRLSPGRAHADRVLDGACAGALPGARQESPAVDGCGAGRTRRQHDHVSRQTHSPQVHRHRSGRRRHRNRLRSGLPLAG